MPSKISRQSIYLFVLSAIILLITFPQSAAWFTTGLDSPYAWALNHLFQNDYEALKNIIYPIGPLGFLKHPVAIGNNWLIAVIFLSAVKFLFIYLLLSYSVIVSKKITVTAVILTFVAAIAVHLDLAIIGSCVLLLLHEYHKKNYALFGVAVLLASVGFFIKSSMGISSFAAVFTFLAIDFYRNKDAKTTAIYTGVAIAVFLIAGLVVFHDVSLLYAYARNSLKIAVAYSSALSLYPENNWLLLGTFILLMLLFPFILYRKKGALVPCLMLLPVAFMMWKHSISRQDLLHYNILFLFLVVFWAIILIGNPRRRMFISFFAVATIGLYFLNMQNVPYFSGLIVGKPFNTNFYNSIILHGQNKQKYAAQSIENIKPNKLEPEILALIGDSSIDIYPNDLSYIPANNLNWQMRSTLQSGGFSSWLDSQSARNFLPQEGPEFVLFHLTADEWANSFGYIDNRYILNDEPRTVYNLFNFYNIIEKRQNYLLLKKAERPNFKGKTDLRKETREWNEWIDVPQPGEDILRAKFTATPNFLYHLKAFLYKNEAFFIDYKLRDGRILNYRFILSNAQDGLWINPLVMDPQHNYPDPVVEQVRFRNTNEALLEDQISLEWEKILLNSEEKNFTKEPYAGVQELFKKDSAAHSEPLHFTLNNFGSQTSGWDLSSFLPDSSNTFSGNYSARIPVEGFSAQYKLDLNHLWSNDIESVQISSEIMYKMGKGVANMVVALQGENANELWRSYRLTNRTGIDEWHYAVLQLDIDRQSYPEGVLTFYIWNSSEEEINIDDYRITIIERKQAL